MHTLWCIPYGKETACEIRAATDKRRWMKVRKSPHLENLEYAVINDVVDRWPPFSNRWRVQPWRKQRSISTEPSSLARLYQRICLLTCLKTSPPYQGLWWSGFRWKPNGWRCSWPWNVRLAYGLTYNNRWLLLVFKLLCRLMSSSTMKGGVELEGRKR